MPDPAFRLERIERIADLPASDWDALAHGPSVRLAAEANVPCEPPESPREAAESADEAAESPREEDEANPFISHAFLDALEQSGSVGPGTGWLPCHHVLRDRSGRLVGALPAYRKSHSRGEYVFDHAFADAWQRAGGRYYPKMQVSVPFTPATGRRLLLGTDDGADRRAEALIDGLGRTREALGASSSHATFLTRRDAQRFAEAGYLLRHDQQFHFENEGYADFDAFLDRLASRKRKAIRRERRDALASGLAIVAKTGREIREADWDAFWDFYQDTGARKWGTPYLTRAFFSRIGETMGDRILLLIAERDGRPIAGALNFLGANTLYGRNWGALEHHPFLHFELCYYQAMEFAIARGLKRVEAGAQGEHKLARGYRPVRTVSAHAFAESGFQRAVAAYLERERDAVAEAQAELDRLAPFRRQ